MDLSKKLFGSEEERAVSPVIGVILMVAITVILAAVIAAFVLDLGPSETNPTAAVDIDGDGTSEVTLTLHSSDNADGIAVVSQSHDNISGQDLATVGDPGGNNEYVYIDTTSTTGSSITVDGNEVDPTNSNNWITDATTNNAVTFDVIVYQGEDPDPSTHANTTAVDNDDAISVVVLDEFTVERTDP